MSQSFKRTELRYRGTFPNLAIFSPEAVQCLKNHINEHARFLITESVHFADARKVKNYKETVTPADVTNAVASHKLRRPSKKWNYKVIAVDVLIVISSLIITLVFGFELHKTYKTLSVGIIAVFSTIIVTCCLFKFSNDPNYAN